MNKYLQLILVFVLFSLSNVTMVNACFAKEASTRASPVYLEISLKISDDNRTEAVAIYKKYKQPFLSRVSGAESKSLLIRNEDVQVLHGFNSIIEANNYLSSKLFKDDVVKSLSPLLDAAPEVRIYKVL